VGVAILEGMAVRGASAATAEAVGAAAISGGTSAVNTAIQGGNVEDVLKAGAIGAASGAAGSEVGGAVGEATGSKVAGAGAGGFTRGFTGAELSGQNLDTSLKRGAVTGATSAGTEALFPDVTAKSDTSDQVLKGLTSSTLSSTLGSVLGLTPTTTSSGIPGQSTQQVGVAPTTQGAGTTPGTQALGQALGVFSGDLSAPIQLGGKDDQKRNVWNQASLRTQSDTGV
jgi:hypothetical protein